MRILEITSGVGVCGALVHTFQIAKELTRRGNRLILVARPGSWILEPARKAGVEVVENDLRRYTLRDFRAIRELCKARGIEVVLAHQSKANNFAVWLKYFVRVPVVLRAHSHRLHFHWRMADHVIAVSEQTRQFHIRYNRVPPHKISTVHGFIDPERLFVPEKGVRQEVRTELGIAPTDFVIGTVGNIIPRKGQLYLIRALHEIVRHAPHVKVILAGIFHPPRFERQIRAEMAHPTIAPHILWVGERNDIPRLLQAMDLFCLPSLSDMLPLSLLEAMWASLPVVVTNAGGLPEAVSDGVEGWVVPPKDPRAIARAILEAIRDPKERARRGQNAHQRVANSFTVGSQVAKIEAILQQVVHQYQRR